MLREKVHPFQTVTGVKGAGVEEPAAFVKHDNALHFFPLVCEIMEVKRKTPQTLYIAEFFLFRGQVKVCLCSCVWRLRQAR